MQRLPGYRSPGSGVGSGYPHGHHKKDARRERALNRLLAQAKRNKCTIDEQFCRSFPGFTGAAPKVAA